jgi:hypothetical protein
MKAEETFKRLQTSDSPWESVLYGTLFCMGVCSAEVRFLCKGLGSITGLG